MPNRARREQSRHAEAGRQLGAALKRARLERGLSQQDVATRARVAIGTVRAIEGRRTLEPGFFTVVALAMALELDLAAYLPPAAAWQGARVAGDGSMSGAGASADAAP